jgi:hypothetical protein
MDILLQAFGDRFLGDGIVFKLSDPLLKNIET